MGSRPRDAFAEAGGAKKGSGRTLNGTTGGIANPFLSTPDTPKCAEEFNERRVEERASNDGSRREIRDRKALRGLVPPARQERRARVRTPLAHRATDDGACP